MCLGKTKIRLSPIWFLIAPILCVLAQAFGADKVGKGDCKDSNGNGYSACIYSDYFLGGLDDCLYKCYNANGNDGRPGRCQAFAFGKVPGWTGGRWCFIYFSKGEEPLTEADCPAATCQSCSRAKLGGHWSGSEGKFPVNNSGPENSNGEFSCYRLKPGRVSSDSWPIFRQSLVSPQPRQIYGSDVSYGPQPSNPGSGCDANPGGCLVGNRMGWDYAGKGMCLDSDGMDLNYCHYNSGYPSFDDDCADICLHHPNCIGVAYGVGPKPGWIGAYHCFVYFKKGEEPNEYACCPVLGMGPSQHGILHRVNGGQFFGGTPQTYAMEGGAHDHNGELVLQALNRDSAGTKEIAGGDGTWNIACFRRGNRTSIEPFRCPAAEYTPPQQTGLQWGACKPHLNHGGCRNWANLTDDRSIGEPGPRAPGLGASVGAKAYVQDTWQQEWGSAQLSMSQCRQKCYERPECVSFSWNRVSCWLYKGNCDPAPAGDPIAGVRGVMPGSQTVTLFEWDSYTDCRQQDPPCTAHPFSACSNWENLTRESWTTQWQTGNLDEPACQQKCMEDDRCKSFTWRSGKYEYRGSGGDFVSGENQFTPNVCYLYPANCIPVEVDCDRGNDGSDLQSPECYYSYTDCKVSRPASPSTSDSLSSTQYATSSTSHALSSNTYAPSSNPSTLSSTPTVLADGSTDTTSMAPSQGQARLVTGSLTVSVSDPANFASNDAVKTALQQAIAANLANVSVEMVEIISVTVARRLSVRLDVRRLAGDVEVQYKITIPASATNVVAPTITSMKAIESGLKDSLLTTLQDNGVTGITINSVVANAVETSFITNALKTHVPSSTTFALSFGGGLDSDSARSLLPPLGFVSFLFATLMIFNLE